MFAYAQKTLARLIGDKKGVTALEYGVIAATTVVAVSAAMAPVKTALLAVFSSIATAL